MAARTLIGAVPGDRGWCDVVLAAIRDIPQQRGTGCAARMDTLPIERIL
ncbi:MAG: hypothetical protein M1493_04915 [Firmicutes bacterium]|nr:hypothetical protein [Bacillota bacterium]